METGTVEKMNGRDECIAHAWQELQKFQNGIIKEHCIICGIARLRNDGGFRADIQKAVAER